MANENTASKKRIWSLDIAKGIGIILVMIVHICYVKPGNGGGSGIVVSIANAATNSLGYLMPLFFFISGYFYRAGRRTYGQNVILRLKQILIPYLVYFAVISAIMTLYLTLRCGYSLSDCFTDMRRSFLGVSFMPKLTSPMEFPTPLGVCLETGWFLRTMFMSELVFLFVADFALKNLRRLICVSLGLMGFSCLLMEVIPVHLFWNAECVFALAAMSLIGAYTGSKKAFDGELPKTFKFWITMIIMEVVAVVLANLFPGVQLLSNGKFGDYGGFSVFTACAMTVIGAFPFITLCRLLEKVKPVRLAMTEIGQATLHILMLHIIVAYFINQLTGLFISDVITKTDVSEGPLWQSILVIIIDAVVCILIVRLIRFIRYKKIQPFLSAKKTKS